MDECFTLSTLRLAKRPTFLKPAIITNFSQPAIFFFSLFFLFFLFFFHRSIDQVAVVQAEIYGTWGVSFALPSLVSFSPAVQQLCKAAVFKVASSALAKLCKFSYPFSRRIPLATLSRSLSEHVEIKTREFRSRLKTRRLFSIRNRLSNRETKMKNFRCKAGFLTRVACCKLQLSSLMRETYRTPSRFIGRVHEIRTPRYSRHRR